MSIELEYDDNDFHNNISYSMRSKARLAQSDRASDSYPDAEDGNLKAASSTLAVGYDF